MKIEWDKPFYHCVPFTQSIFSSSANERRELDLEQQQQQQPLYSNDECRSTVAYIGGTTTGKNLIRSVKPLEPDFKEIFNNNKTSGNVYDRMLGLQTKYMCMVHKHITWRFEWNNINIDENTCNRDIALSLSLSHSLDIKAITHTHACWHINTYAKEGTLTRMA